MIGPLGPISTAAREWLSRNILAMETLLESETGAGSDLVTAEERCARVEQLMKFRTAGLEREAAEKRARAERRNEAAKEEKAA